MMRIGITGGIGSGKTTVCELFATLGIPVYNSDRRARELMNGDAHSPMDGDAPAPMNGDTSNDNITDSAEIRQAITALLGPEAYRNGRLDNAFIASKVFADKMLLASLNAIVHPAVARDFEAWVSHFSAVDVSQRSRSAAIPPNSPTTTQHPAAPPYLILESAILFESGFYRFVDKIVTVSAPETLRIERVLARGKTGEAISREQVLERMANQLTDSEREARADYTITNDGTTEQLSARVAEIDKLLKQ
jgi:dephospho-CoA kinase